MAFVLLIFKCVEITISHTDWIPWRSLADKMMSYNYQTEDYNLKGLIKKLP